MIVTHERESSAPKASVYGSCRPRGASFPGLGYYLVLYSNYGGLIAFGERRGGRKRAVEERIDALLMHNCEMFRDGNTFDMVHTWEE